MSRLFCAKHNAFLLSILFLMIAVSAQAQTTVFTYQGRFTDSTLPQPTNGSYEMQYKLFDAATVGTGNQVGAVQTVSSVSVVNGIFTVQINFGGTVFRSVDLFVEIGVRPIGSQSAFTILAPRQQLTTAPLSIRSRIANSADDSSALGGIPANQYVQTNDARLSDDRNPNPFSANYIQSQNANSQAANFNINGTGAANIFNAATQFNIGGSRFLSGGGGNVFAGLNSGTASTTGGDNSFFGTNAGMTNTTGFNNSFFGTDAGRNNTGVNNSFFGRSAGYDNTTGGDNSFFGLDAGRFNTTGNQNAFFGVEAGGKNIGGVNNTFTGGYAGYNNLTGADNSFVGLSSGFSNTLGANNAFVGRSAGQNNTTGNTNSFFGNFAGAANTIGSNNSAFGNSADFSVNNLNFATAIGAGAVVSTSNTIALGRSNGSDLVQIFGLGAVGSIPLCRNAANQISTCTAAAFGGAFINNSTAQQALSNFNISGSGTVGAILSANIVNSITNYKIGNNTVFSTPNSMSIVVGQFSNHTLLSNNNAFFGYKAGQSANSFSQANTFIGSDSGESNTGGGNNSFVGRDSGLFNLTGSFNSFFGSGAGQSNSTANANSFFGYFAGNINSTGARNSFFGFQAGLASQTVNDNSFFGYQAGSATTGGGNSFFGSFAGSATTGGLQNTFVGNSAGITTTTGNSNSLFGSFTKTSGNNNTLAGTSSNADGNNNVVIGNNANSFGSNNTLIGFQAQTVGGLRQHSTAIGADAQVDTDNTIVLGTPIDTVEVPTLLKSKSITVEIGINTGSIVGGFGKFDELRLTNTPLGITPMCLDSVKRIGVCPASIAYKSDAAGTTLAKTVQDQQTQISAQAEQIKQQQAQIEALKQIVCSQNPTVELCKVNK